MRHYLLTGAVALALAGLPAAANASDATATDVFGAPRPMSAEKAKELSLAWLKTTHPDAVTLKQAADIWDDPADRPVLDRVAETLLLGSPEGRELIAAARDPEQPAPLKVPAIFVDPQQPIFFRANLGLYFAKHMAGRRVYEECLATLKAFKAEDTVDPATYYFYKAVAANRLLFKDEALANIERLKEAASAAPERYIVVATLMELEMSLWKKDDLGDIARRMKEVEDRLENARHGKVTIDKEEEIVKMLAKLIEDLEKQQNSQPGPPSSGPPNGNRSTSPANDSAPAKGEGDGNIDPKALVRDLKVWGSLPEKDRIRALEAIKKEYSPEIAEAIRGYLIKGGLLPADR